MSNQDFGFDPPANPPLGNLANGAMPKQGQQLPPAPTTQSVGPDPGLGTVAQTIFPRNYQYWTQSPPPIAPLPNSPDVKAQSTDNPYAVPAAMEAVSYAPGPEALAGRMMMGAATELGAGSLEGLAARQAAQYGVGRQYNQSQTPAWQNQLVGGSPQDAQPMHADDVMTAFNNPSMDIAGTLMLARHGPPRGYRQIQDYLMMNEQGNHVGDVSVTPIDENHIHINHMNARGGPMSQGPSSIRSLLSEFKREYPGLRKMSMFRVTGARMGPAVTPESAGSSRVDFNVPEHIKANQPNKWSDHFLDKVSKKWMPRELRPPQQEPATSNVHNLLTRGQLLGQRPNETQEQQIARAFRLMFRSNE